MSGTMAQINQLAAERTRLYQWAVNGHRPDVPIGERIAAIDAELERLWEARRQERAGRREGIDLIVERAYERIYGANFDDAVTPPGVDEGEDEGAVVSLVA